MKTPVLTNYGRSTTPARGTADLIGNEAWHAKRARAQANRTVFDHQAAVGYARFSTPGQHEESIERQVKGIQRAATVKKLRLLDIYADREVSGIRSDRKELSAMIRFLRSSAVRPATVLIESADRLARDTRVFIDLWDELKKIGVALHDNKHGLIDSDLKAAIVGAMAAQDWGAIRYRTKAGREQHAAKGRIMAGAGFGYRMVPGSPGERTVCPTTSVHVRHMFQMRAAGMSIGRICKVLQNAGVTTSDGDRLWYRSTVSKILANPIYKGVSAYNRTETTLDEFGRSIVRNRPPEEVIQAEVDDLRIVEDDVWNKVQTLWRDKVRADRDRVIPGGKYLLQGKVICPECNKPMRATDGRASVRGKISYKPRWRCSTLAENHGCGNNHSFYMDIVEQHLFAALAEILDQHDFEQRYFSSADAAIAEHNSRLQVEVDVLTGKMETLNQRIFKSLEEGYGAGFKLERVVKFREGMERQIAEMEERQDELKRRLKAAPRKSSHVLALRPCLDGLSAQVPFVPEDAAGHELRAALRDLIGPITVTRGEAHGSLDILIHFDLVGDGSRLPAMRRHRLDWSDDEVAERNRRAEAHVEARTYQIDERRWASLRDALPGFADLRQPGGEVMHRLLVEAVLVAATTQATKSVVYRLMKRKWGRNFVLFGIDVQKNGGFDQLEEALRRGSLPEVGPLDLSALRYFERPNRRKRPKGDG